MNLRQIITIAVAGLVILSVVLGPWIWRAFQDNNEREISDRKQALLKERLEELGDIEITVEFGDEVIERMQDTQSIIDALPSASPYDIPLSDDNTQLKHEVYHHRYISSTDVNGLDIDHVVLNRINKIIGDELWLLIMELDAYASLQAEMLNLVALDTHYEKRIDFDADDPDSVYGRYHDRTLAIHKRMKSLHDNIDERLYNMQLFKDTRRAIFNVLESRYHFNYLKSIWWQRKTESMYAQALTSPFHVERSGFMFGSNGTSKRYYVYQRSMPVSEAFATSYTRVFPHLGRLLLGPALPALANAESDTSTTTAPN